MSDHPLLVGVSGGIGSGKSTVCEIFRALQVPVYDADSRAKWLINHHEQLRRSIIDQFGAESYQDGQLNRQHLAKAFEDPEQLEVLNRLVHPTVGKDFENWVASNDQILLVKEAALLFETGSYRQLDKMILIRASEETRIRRIIERDPFRSEEEIRQIMDRQWPDEKKVPLADFIIDNEPNSQILGHVLRIHRDLTTGYNVSRT